jgi:hypothetical protein
MFGMLLGAIGVGAAAGPLLLRRFTSTVARVGLPRTVAKPVKEQEAVVWDAADVDRFLTASGKDAFVSVTGGTMPLRRSRPSLTATRTRHSDCSGFFTAPNSKSSWIRRTPERNSIGCTREPVQGSRTP